MSEFARLLAQYRAKKGMTQAQLADKVSTSAQYVSALERQKGAKSPSVHVLKELLRALAWDEEAGLWDLPAARDLAFSAMDLTVPLPMPANIQQELASQTEAPEGSEIWVVSDVLAEAESSDYASITAANVLTRRMKYTFFVPFVSWDPHDWDRALGWLRDQAREMSMDPAKLEEGVSAFQISDCAFLCRLRITNPRSNDASASYGLGARAEAHLMFSPAPTELVVKSVNTLTKLLKAVEEAEGDALNHGADLNDRIYGYLQLGFIRRIFPT